MPGWNSDGHGSELDLDSALRLADPSKETDSCLSIEG